MNDKRNPNGDNVPPQSEAVESTFAEFLTCFYDKNDRAKAIRLAAHLESLLAASPEYKGSIREQEIRSLIAEIRQDLGEAARYREAEIRKILELHSLSTNTPSWPAVAQRYDFSDVSDRLDLLAIIYDDLGQTDAAINVLRESKQYCAAHGIRFDAQDVLDEFETQRRDSTAASGRHRKCLVRRGGKGDLPETRKQDIHRFARSLKARPKWKLPNGWMFGRDALAPDWNTPEEDAAWAKL